MRRIPPALATVVMALVPLWLVPEVLSAPPKAGDHSIAGPAGDVRFHLLEDAAGRLKYQIDLGKRTVVEPSGLGIVVDGVDLGQGARVEKVSRYEINERYPWRGVHSTAVNHCRGARFGLLHAETGTRFVLDVRVFDDGAAFRHIVPGKGARTPDAAVEFKIPAGSTVWHHNLRGHYEGVHSKDPIESVEEGTWIAPPLTIKLPDNAGYVAITEAALVNYAGMALQAGRDRVVHERLGHDQPLGYPFELRFGKEEGERLRDAAAIEGEIVTPWRVLMVGEDLNTLVNCDILHNVSSPADKELFPQGMHTDWIKPGRSVWRFLDGGDNSRQGMRDFSRWAGELGFEYSLLEGFWQKWSKRELRSLVEYSQKHNVEIWLWKDSRALRTPEARAEFFGLCREVGVVGVKIDFLDHEAKEVIDLYYTLLKEAAQHELMVNFHGSNKPTGEARTWPNELTREGVRGMEARLPSRAAHDATLPFTRYLAGHGDYTPVVFGERRADTTAAHQIATAALFVSPMLVYGGHPQSLLEHPAVEMIKSIPSVWDETIVLPGSTIGEVAAFARRHGDEWFLAILAGTEGRKMHVSLSFLDAGRYDAMLVRDVADEPTEVAIDHLEVKSADALHINLADGGGFIGRFTRREQPLSAVNPLPQD